MPSHPAGTPQTSAVCVTSGLMQIMDDNELTGVLAHELGHIKNYDIRVSMIAFALSAVISIIADFILRITWFSDRDDRNNNQALMVLGIIAAHLGTAGGYAHPVGRQPAARIPGRCH
ncbi:MAG: M48 family metalloprotease [Candidatus Saccharibacteria bacterium]